MREWRRGPRDYPHLSRFTSRALLGGLAVWSSLAVMAGANEFHDRDGMYIGMIINVFLSAAFILMLRRRDSSVGQYLHIAVAKFLGTFSAGLTGFLLYPSRVLFLVLIPTMVVLESSTSSCCTAGCVWRAETRGASAGAGVHAGTGVRWPREPLTAPPGCFRSRDGPARCRRLRSTTDSSRGPDTFGAHRRGARRPAPDVTFRDRGGSRHVA
ncbi:hypothetical protein SAMN04487904_1095 [Actinopolyspora lacussalsi subsp. righensis]|uniref:Uncharacterized protein n=1 Tax=Actinopolyspora righensis TaxID=995060 RepID=A0A1I7B143_9ACTN|nr:hypothetical protein SAMN04487904_1095 [Actinopolyspora righensis]